MCAHCLFAVFLFTSLLTTFDGSAQAQSDKESQPIEVKGCVKKGVEAGCLILITLDNKSYSLHGKDLPTLDKKLVVSVKGTTGGVDTCMQGTVMQVSSWSWTRMKCPKETSGTDTPKK